LCFQLSPGFQEETFRCAHHVAVSSGSVSASQTRSGVEAMNRDVDELLLLHGVLPFESCFRLLRALRSGCSNFAIHRS